MEHGEVIPASVWGKIKTSVQVAMVLAQIVVDGDHAWVDALIYTTVVVTVISGVVCFFSFRALLHARPSSHTRVKT